MSFIVPAFALVSALAPMQMAPRTTAAPALSRASVHMDSTDDVEEFDIAKARRSYGELSREYRRTVFMHDEWVQHRSSERFWSNLGSIFESGVGRQLSKELIFLSFVSVFVIAGNGFLGGYTDLDGVAHASPIGDLGKALYPMSIPASFFSTALASLSLLLVFRANTGYSRWNEARTLWGGIINTCRNVVRQGNMYFPEGPAGDDMRNRLMVNTAMFCRALRNFLRGPTDDAILKGELYADVVKGKMTREMADACMAASNRPMFAINCIGAVIKEANLDEFDRSRMDASLTTLADLTGANERIFKSPIPLVYTRHTSRFLILFCALLPLGIWPVMGDYWNHWVTLPVSLGISFFLLGIEEIGLQCEEPFSILPLEAFCNGAIAATMAEMVDCTNAKAFAVAGLSPAPTPASEDSTSRVALPTIAPLSAPEAPAAPEPKAAPKAAPVAVAEPVATPPAPAPVEVAAAAAVKPAATAVAERPPPSSAAAAAIKPVPPAKPQSAKPAKGAFGPSKGWGVFKR